jgi:hypothetical protein
MIVDLVGAVAAVISKSIADESRNDFAGGEIPKQAVVEAHESDGDGHARIDRDLHLVGRFLRQSFAVLHHALHDIRIRLSMFLSASASVAPQVEAPCCSRAGQ